MKILGIETSCDETAISLIEVKGDNVKILGNTVHSQIDLHAAYGGVFPVLAKREHEKNLVPVLEKTLIEADLISPSKQHFNISRNVEMLLEREKELLKAFRVFIPSIKKPDIDYISVTMGPGLEPALWVGISFARALASAWNIPLVPCNHMEGHILSALISGSEKNYNLVTPQFPALSLLISGGHTQIILIKSIGDYTIVGDTRDDAVGECFDKVARMLGLPYPGGPKISKLAALARTENINSPEPLPRPMIGTDNLDFSFSGLKTAVLYLVKRLEEKGIALDDSIRKGISREVEEAITDVIIEKMRKAIEAYAIETLIIGGGVIANTYIRTALQKLADDCGVRLLLPQFEHSTDNGLMIALAGYFNREKATSAETKIIAKGTLPLGPRG